VCFVLWMVLHNVARFAVALALIAGGSAAFAQDVSSLIGNYTQNVPCKGDGSDPVAVQVKISAK
jgi:hypothetical protein